MAIKIGKNGELHCNTVKFNYKQCRNLIADGSCNAESGMWNFEGVTYGSYPNPYQSKFCFQFPGGNGTYMATQSMPTPIAGHKYYGGLLFCTLSDTFSSSDNRFEWYCNDTANGHMVFAYKDVATNGNWVKLTSIKSLDNVATGEWKIRNFQVNPTGESYCCKLMIIDLTETFGAGNEPTKEWCDENIREWETFSNFGVVSEKVTNTNIDDVFVFEGMKNESNKIPYGYADSSLLPREYYLYVKPVIDNVSWESFIYSSNNINLTPSDLYYLQMEVGYDYTPSILEANANFDCYFPEEEPALGTVYAQDNTLFNGGGLMSGWKRYSFFNDRTSFSAGSYPMRIDINHDVDKDPRGVYLTAIALVKPEEVLAQYNLKNGSSLTKDSINKEWCDRWIDGFSSPIIHIKDPNNTKIKFNTNYDIVCNDIEIRPEIDKVKFDFDTGTIYCSKLIKEQEY